MADKIVGRVAIFLCREYDEVDMAVQFSRWLMGKNEKEGARGATLIFS